AASVVSRAGAKIAFGGSRAEHMPWLDFGGTVPGWPGRGGVSDPSPGWPGSPKTRPVTRDWRGRPVDHGRYVYITIAEMDAEIEEGVAEALARAARINGFDTKGD